MSLINYEPPKHVEFIFYSGGVGELCAGTLLLKIDGTEYCFRGDKDETDGGNENGAYKSFWESGGAHEYGNMGGVKEWIIDASKLPEHLRKHAVEIDKVFNKNVEWGCCGACFDV